MKKQILSALMGAALISQSALAIIPNTWSSGFGQGWMEYDLINEKGDSISIGCGGAAAQENMVSFFKKGNDFEGNYKFLINGKYYFHKESETKQGAKNWYAFIKAISSAKQIDVYSGDKKISSFNNIKGKSKAPDGNCSAFRDL